MSTAIVKQSQTVRSSGGAPLWVRIQATVRLYPARLAVASGSRTLTFSDLEQQAYLYGSTLQCLLPNLSTTTAQATISPRVAFCLSLTSDHALVLALALARLGLVAVPLNTRWVCLYLDGSLSLC